MTSSQCDPRPGQDDTIGGDARDDVDTSVPFAYPVSVQDLDKKAHEPVLVDANSELIAELVAVTRAEAEHIAERLNCCESAIYKMKLLGWHVDGAGDVVNERLQRTFPTWDDALDWCVGEACE